jgi:hypothetical protein
MESMCNLDWEIIISYSFGDEIPHKPNRSESQKKSTILVGFVTGKFFVGTIIGGVSYHEDWL